MDTANLARHPHALNEALAWAESRGVVRILSLESLVAFVAEWAAPYTIRALIGETAKPGEPLLFAFVPASHGLPEGRWFAGPVDGGAWAFLLPVAPEAADALVAYLAYVRLEGDSSTPGWMRNRIRELERQVTPAAGG